MPAPSVPDSVYILVLAGPGGRVRGPASKGPSLLEPEGSLSSKRWRSGSRGLRKSRGITRAGGGRVGKGVLEALPQALALFQESRKCPDLASRLHPLDLGKNVLLAGPSRGGHLGPPLLELEPGFPQAPATRPSTFQNREPHPPPVPLLPLLPLPLHPAHSPSSSLCSHPRALTACLWVARLRPPPTHTVLTLKH